MLPDPSFQLLVSVDYASSIIARQSCHASAERNKRKGWVSILNERPRRIARESKGNPRRAAHMMADQSENILKIKCSYRSILSHCVLFLYIVKMEKQYCIYFIQYSYYFLQYLEHWFHCPEILTLCRFVYYWSGNSFMMPISDSIVKNSAAFFLSIFENSAVFFFSVKNGFNCIVRNANYTN